MMKNSIIVIEKNKLNETKQVIKQVLRDFKALESNTTDITYEKEVERTVVDRTLFPVPELISLVLVGICGFSFDYPGEKTHWIIPFSYKGVNCAISYEKFGVRLYISKQTQVEINEKELLGKIKKSINIVENKILNDFAKDQIKKGNIIILNQFNEFDNRYIYFRDNAKTLYENSKKEDLIEWWRSNQEANYNALAMINAYFSRLEHFLVLALPFFEYDRDKEDLTVFVGQSWSKKFKKIFGTEQKQIKSYYDKLINIKEKYRNTFAHGGLEKKGASFYFRFPGYGAIPARMSGYKDSVHFNFIFPIEEKTFLEICSLFDKFDSWISESGAPYAWKYAVSGLPMSFEKKSISEMLSFTSDLKTFEKWIEKLQYIGSKYANAEY